MPVKARQVQTQRQRVRQRWLHDVEQIVRQVEKWAKDRKWAVRREQKLIEEPRLGAYYVPVASILAPAGQVQVEPVARYVAGGDGRIDLLAWPSLTRMMLIREGNRWVLRTDSGVRWPQGWSQRTFAYLVEALNAAA